MKHRVGNVLAAAFVALSFLSAMAYEVQVDPIGINLPVGSWVIRARIAYKEVQFFTTSRPDASILFWNPNYYPAHTPWTFPLPLVAIVFSVWPLIWWHDRFRRGFDHIGEGSAAPVGQLRRCASAIVLCHLLTSYLLYLFLRWPVDHRFISHRAVGYRLVDSPLFVFLQFRSIIADLWNDNTMLWSRAQVVTQLLVYLLLFSVAFWLIFVKQYHARRRYSSGSCQRCGYDLRATPERCPECGTVSDVAVQPNP